MSISPISLSRKELVSSVKTYVIITFFLAVYAVTVVGFLINAEIVGGGVNGIATLIYYASNKWVPVGYSTFAINGILLLLGLKILGKAFGAKTVYAIFVMSFFVTIAQSYITEPFLGNDLTLSAAIGGILIGLCIGSIFNVGGSTGGTDIVAMIVNKYRDVTPGRVILYADVFIISSSFIVFHFFLGKDPLEAFRIVIYGFVVMAVSSYTIDLVMLGAQQSVQLQIFTKKHDDIAKAISTEMHRGVTLIHGKGWYTQEETEIVMVVTRKNQMRDVLRLVKTIDPEAFTTIGTVTGVYGKGFAEIKEK